MLLPPPEVIIPPSVSNVKFLDFILYAEPNIDRIVSFVAVYDDLVPVTVTDAAYPESFTLSIDTLFISPSPFDERAFAS